MKKIICLLLCFLMLAGLAACEAEKTSYSITYANTASDKTSETDDNEDFKNEDTSDKSSSKNKNSNEKPSSSKNLGSSANKKSSSSKALASSDSKYPGSQKEIEIRRANQNKFKKVGRWIVNANQLGIGLNWTCSSVEFNIDCIGELALQFEKSGTSEILYLKIYVDGKLIAERTNVTSGQLTIATNLAAGVHNVKIVRSSDGDCGALTLKKVVARGELVDAPKNGSLYIEAIGDASMIALGSRLPDDFYVDFNKNINEKQPIARDKENQDGTVSYPYIAAGKLGADAYIVAKQGAGIAATFHKSNGVCVPRIGLLPTICEYAAASGNTKYTVDRLPDVFVIDAGYTDIRKELLSAVKYDNKVGIDANRAKLISIDFLKSLKKINPAAKIIWCYGFARKNEDLKNHISDIVSSVGGADKGIFALELPFSARGDYASPEDHAAAAEVLANKIKEITK